jgi:methionyl-tRNA synthetase
LEVREEENYFFRFSKYQGLLLDLYQKNPRLVIPDFRFNEIRAFVERGLEDFSISRLKVKMPWGVEVPDDGDHVMYVWFDALVNYISTLGWPKDVANFEKFWVNGTPTQYAGKDNLRQQSAMWQAMLMSAGLPPTHNIVINGFINSGGQKMSKSLGNVISPYEVVNEYGTDALRYYCLRELAVFEDSDMTMEKFKEAYNANLANGLGNLVSRIMKMAVDNIEKLNNEEIEKLENEEVPGQFFEHLENFEINKSCDLIWEQIGEMDKFIQENQPFKIVKTDKETGQKMIYDLVARLYLVARMLIPILPETSAKIKSLIKENKIPEKPLFVRKG